MNFRPRACRARRLGLVQQQLTEDAALNDAIMRLATALLASGGAA